jgi:hypothetical protein
VQLEDHNLAYSVYVVSDRGRKLTAEEIVRERLSVDFVVDGLPAKMKRAFGWTRQTRGAASRSWR